MLRRCARSRRARACGIVLFLAGAVLLAAEATHAYTGGADPGDGLEGCGGATCHVGAHGTPQVDSRIVVELQGLPERFRPNAVYPLSLGVGAPAELRREGDRTKAGFAAETYYEGEPVEGSFLPEPPFSRVTDRTLTHTSQGSRLYAWTFKWTAPPMTDRPVELYVTVMAASGGAANTDRDSWSTQRFVVWPERTETPGLSVLAGLASAVLGLWIRRGKL